MRDLTVNHHFNEERDMWEIYEGNGTDGYKWIFNKKFFDTLEDCMVEVDNDIDYQWTLKDLGMPNKLKQALENYKTKYQSIEDADTE